MFDKFNGYAKFSSKLLIINFKRKQDVNNSNYDQIE